MLVTALVAVICGLVVALPLRAHARPNSQATHVSVHTRGSAARRAPLTAAQKARAALLPGDSPGSHSITYDKYSLMINGKRQFIWSGEFDYWRLPSPSEWLDVLQKMKTEGYNAVTIYFNWAYHSPKPGVYDFSGVRNVSELLNMAARVGLYVIARPGPYINGETSGGGLPGWLNNVAGKARTNAPDYMAAADQWLAHIDPIIARHQLTNGTGTVILYQIENELAATGPGEYAYMANLYDRARSDGITVPIFHNDKGRHGIWVPASSHVPGTVQGPNDLYAFDGYPGGTCSSDGSVGSPSSAPDWGIWGSGGATGGASASPDTPGFTAEFGGGWFDYWGSVGTYDCTAQRQGPGYERVFYGTNIVNRLTIENFYMTFGGTNWGWLPAPVVYTSYDYGAAINEARQLRPKATTMKELGLFLQSVAPTITHVDQGAPVTASSANVKVDDDVDNGTGTHFYFVVHNPSNATTDDSFTFPITTSDGTYTIPQQGTLQLDGQDAKALVADYDMDGQHLVYSTSELMTHFVQGRGDIALLYGRDGEDGETVLRYAAKPAVRVVSGNVTTSWNASTGDLRLDYVHNGLAAVRITGGGRPPLTLLLADTTTAGSFWRQDTPDGAVLEQGPELVRTATIHGATLSLTGDTSARTTLKVWAPPQVHLVRFNGHPTAVTVGGQAGGSAVARGRLTGPAPISLPDLSTARWHYAPESPEARPGFSDSGWQPADKTTTTSTTPPPAGQPVLTADDYGFHQGDIWYRGTYSGASSARTITLHYGGGGAGVLQAWLDGVYLGQNVLSSGVSSPPTTGNVTFAIPAELQSDSTHTLAVMVRNDGRNEDGGVNDAQKEGRGLISVAFNDAAGAAVGVTPSWRIQGDLGGEDLADPVRGIENDGGLYGERHGWYLPGYPDRSWPTTTLPAGNAISGTAWYRTTFKLHIPKVDDASLGLTIGDPATPQSSGDYRALIFVNGWNMGQYIADVGPQHTFVIPNGVLDPDGRNTVAIAVTSDGGAGNGLEKVALTNLGTVRGGVPLTIDRSPGWNAATYGRPSVPDDVTMEGITSTGGHPAVGGSTFTVTSTVDNASGPAATGVAAHLDVPAGWTATAQSQTDIGTLGRGASRTLSWTVTVPAGVAAGTYAVAPTVTYTQAGTTGTTGASTDLTVVPAGTVYISDLPFISATNGYGPVERDTNVGGSGAGDGTPISVDGVGYAKGLGTNAISSVVVAVPAGCTTFSSEVGVDDSAGGKGTVTFTVLADGTQVAATGVMKGGQPAQLLTANVSGVSQLTLNVGDAGDGIGHDNGDWGDAKFTGCSG
ncbi:MAG TPA: beta-galactosidase [Solirubrobacteraceae bacterium]|nr:beta-galactosidase [Solirubrobacteraceae bacterium]